VTAADTTGRLTALGQVGLSWHESGQASLHGPLLALARQLDTAFCLIAAAWAAREERHPAALDARQLQRVNYLHAFPHQATFPVRLDPDQANLDEFVSGPVIGDDGHVRLTRTVPARQVLTPAACYHLYCGHEGDALTAPAFLTTVNTCFRQEDAYQPLRRQWAFTMREIVCMGTAAEAGDFLDAARAVTGRLLDRLDLKAAWVTAADPFFRPMDNPQYLMQRLFPSKHEAVYGTDLAIGSANLHHEHFGEAFSITRDGEPAHTACLAFGIERWLFALTDRYGTDPECWPDPVPAARRAVSLAGRRE
jgi:seryl-tRNA synthetase